MPRIIYIPRNFNQNTRIIVDQARAICEEYAAQGFVLTLRQLYYQFVSRDYLPNTAQSYDRLGSIVNDARMAGELDWDHVQDRGRNLQRNGHWLSPASIISGSAYGYAIDKWEGQTFRPEVWIEKEALIGVIERPCQARDVSYFACKGYTSSSEMWQASQRFRRYQRNGQIPIILHLGDHDPSGIDMSRDIEDRLTTFLTHHGMEPIEVRRLALNIDQVRQYNPPPNFAKQTDARFKNYMAEYGEQSWELDALNPPVIAALINDELNALVDPDEYKAMEAKEAKEKALLQKAADHWEDIVAFLKNEDEEETDEG